jgi:hypothetical protein
MNDNNTPILRDITWDDWMQFYGKVDCMRDKQKRTFWFDSKWENNQ